MMPLKPYTRRGITVQSTDAPVQFTKPVPTQKSEFSLSRPESPRGLGVPGSGDTCPAPVIPTEIASESGRVAEIGIGKNGES